MIEVIDRVPTYPGRVNKALFESIASVIEATVHAVDNKLFELAQRVTVGSLAVGSVFGLYENGVLVPYLKISTSYEKTERALVIRLDCAKMETFSVAPEAGAYSGGKIDRWLTGEFYNSLDTATQSVLADTTLGMYDYSSIKRKVFLLDSTEYGFWGFNGFNAGNAVTDYFEGNPGRIPQWCRDSSTSSRKANAISVTGTLLELDSFTELAGVRPAMTLPTDFEVIAGMPSTANTMATAEVI